MLNDITLGQFYPSNSIIHKLDPRIKIVLCIFIIAFLFMAENVYGFILAALFSGIIIALSMVPVSYILKGLKPILFIVVFTAILNLFLTDGRILFKIGFLKVTYEGLRFAVFMAVRLVLLITVTNMLTLTTSPILLTDGIERLLSPLKVIKVPAHEIAMMMTIALRFIPTLLEETDKIIKAQSARGADFASGNILTKAKSMVPVLVPLFISAFRRADELAVAMECRCYTGGENRTRMRVLKIKGNDVTACVITFLWAILLLCFNFWF